MANYFLNPYPTQTDDFNHRKEISINSFPMTRIKSG